MPALKRNSPMRDKGSMAPISTLRVLSNTSAK